MIRPVITLLMAHLIQVEPLRENNHAPGCPEIGYIELSRPSTPSDREICIGPGVVTGVIFDLPAEVEFQEEVRFMSILQGRSEVSFRPPRDLAAGERLRLTAKLGTGQSRQEVTFFLVGRPGQVTHQVEVYHDTRPRESLLQEAAEERARNQQLLEENQRLLTEVERMQALLRRFNGLTGAYLSGVLTRIGISAVDLGVKPKTAETFVSEAFSYRSDENIAIEAVVTNNSPEQWTTVGASLLDARGRSLQGVVLSQARTIAPQSQGTVFVEAAAPHDEFGAYTLNLTENGPRIITLPKVVFPHKATALVLP